MEKLYGHFNENNMETMNEAVASKFQLAMSRRKYNFLYKVKSQTYDPQTYPSMYAKVHKSQLTFINGSIGSSPSDTWAAPSTESRSTDLKKLNKYRQ